jgi:hypothetical protein
VFISVSTDPIEAGASLIQGDAGSDGTLPSGTLTNAAASTPVDGAWSTFLTDAIATAVALDQAAIDTAGALQLAAGNYGDTEAVNSGNYKP